MNRSVSTLSLAACLSLFLALTVTPAHAEEDGGESEESSEKKTLEEKVDALITRMDSIKERGQDSVGENGGEIEAAILSAAALDKAAQMMCGDLTESSYLVIGDTAAGEAQLAAMFLGQKAVLEEMLYAAAPGRGGPVGDGGGRGGLAAIGAFANLFSTVVSSEDSYSGISGTLDDEQVLTDMLGSRCSNFTLEIKDDIVPDSSAFRNVMSQLDGATADYNRIKAVKADKRTPAQKAALEAFEKFLTALTTPIDGKLPIVALARSSSWVETMGASKVLHLSIDKSGGTLLKRKNLWTGLGAPSLGITSGIIVRYRVSEPSTGTRAGGGVLYCTTKQSSFRDVHEMRSKLASVAHCEMAGQASPAPANANAKPKRKSDSAERQKPRPKVRLGYSNVV